MEEVLAVTGQGSREDDGWCEFVTAREERMGTCRGFGKHLRLNIPTKLNNEMTPAGSMEACTEPWSVPVTF
jgi:hypothetical protein